MGWLGFGLDRLRDIGVPLDPEAECLYSAENSFLRQIGLECRSRCPLVSTIQSIKFCAGCTVR